MNEFERSYQHYLKHRDRYERKRLRSAAWAKAHPKPEKAKGPDLYLWVAQAHPAASLARS